eukprot:8190214-Pyramimonas_sp.AAC.1
MAGDTAATFADDDDGGGRKAGNDQRAYRGHGHRGAGVARIRMGATGEASAAPVRRQGRSEVPG